MRSIRKLLSGRLLGLYVRLAAWETWTRHCKCSVMRRSKT